jgi:hypothetical protein
MNWNKIVGQIEKRKKCVNGKGSEKRGGRLRKKCAGEGLVAKNIRNVKTSSNKREAWETAIEKAWKMHIELE